MLRLVAEVPAALVQVAPVEVELFDDVFVMPSTPMVHLDGLLEGGAEVAIERVEALVAAGRFRGVPCGPVEFILELGLGPRVLRRGVPVPLPLRSARALEQVKDFKKSDF